MNLKSLLLCSDDKIVRVLRRTLGDLDVSVEHCISSEVALRHLTRDRFEAIIVDCAGPGAAAVLRGARSAPCNKRAVAVAILDPEVGLRSAFDLGAHFTLYKPVSAERAKSSFRAARALMKKERRRISRVPINIPVEMASLESGAHFKVSTSDLGEGGLAVNLPRRSKPHGRWQLSLKLPGSVHVVSLDAEFAWEGPGTQVGFRFLDQSPELGRQLRDWLAQNSPDLEKDDPPMRCKLTDLSLGGCYLDVSSPFPVSTRLTLSMRANEMELKTEGVVRVMHPEKGMGVEFIRTTPEHRGLLEKFLGVLTESPSVLPELLVEPEGLETADSSLNHKNVESSDEAEDTLLTLFRSQPPLPENSFLEELRRLRSVSPTAASASV